VIVLDTHAWLWWVSEPKRLSAAAREAIEGAGSVGVSAISCWEVGMLVSQGRIELDGGLRRWIRQALAQPGLVALPVTPKIGLDAAMLDEQFGGDPADRLIYATARDAGGILVTRDRRMRGFDERGSLW